MSTSNVKLFLLVLVCQFFTVLGVPVNGACTITLDNIDSKNKRFLYTRYSDNTTQRCAYCSAITRTSTNAFNRSKENQCIKKNENIAKVYNLVPNCKYSKDMDPITCVIPHPIENGVWNCSCSAIGSVKHGEVLVYTNCTQQCKPGYELVGDSFGHCGERVPHDKNFPTEFRYGNARCSKREPVPADPGRKEINLIIVTTVCGTVILVVILAVLYCFLKRHLSHGGNGAAKGRSSLQTYRKSSVTEASEQGTEMTSFTPVPKSLDQVTRKKHDKETSSLLTGKEDTEGHSNDKSQDWKYTIESEISTGKLRSRYPPLAEYPESPSMDVDLPSGEPISGLSSFPESSSADKIMNTGVTGCNVHLSNLSLPYSFWDGQHILNRKVNDQKLLCYHMAIDILNCIAPEFEEQKVENELDFLCEGKNPVMEVFFNLLKNYPCNIGHVVQWCVKSGHPSLVPLLVTKKHEQICMYCKNMKMDALQMDK